jgi:hypothetical protein
MVVFVVSRCIVWFAVSRRFFIVCRFFSLAVLAASFVSEAKAKTAAKHHNSFELTVRALKYPVENKLCQQKKRLRWRELGLLFCNKRLFVKQINGKVGFCWRAQDTALCSTYSTHATTNTPQLVALCFSSRIMRCYNL